MYDDGVECITIKKARLVELLEAQQFLQCLEVTGVDSWEGYEDAQILFDDTQEYDKIGV